MSVLRFGFIFIIFFLLLIGPWPVDETHFSNTRYAEQTNAHIHQITPNNNAKTLLANTASFEIVPLPESPLAGYSAREPKANTGSREKLFAKAVTIANSDAMITVVSAEILLPLPELVAAVVQKTGLNRSDIYFTSTHTHSGPGGYARGIVEEASLGDFSSRQFNMLVGTISKAILKSRTNLTEVDLTYTRLTLTDSFAHRYIYNQLFDQAPAHKNIHTLQLKSIENDERIATLITFSAHPTFLGRENRKLSGDYPNPLMAKLEKNLGGSVIFSVGAVGSMLPSGFGDEKIKSVDRQLKQLNQMSDELSGFISTALTHPEQLKKNQLADIISWRSSEAAIQSEVVPVWLPYANYKITDNLRLSPLLISTIFHGSETYIHTLKIGKLFLMSYPADYSGELAKSLEDWATPQGVYPWATSFNGEYLGYLMPSKRHEINHYTTRDVNFYGKWTGDYFLETSKNIISTLK